MFAPCPASPAPQWCPNSVSRAAQEGRCGGLVIISSPLDSLVVFSWLLAQGVQVHCQVVSEWPSIALEGPKMPHPDHWVEGPPSRRQAGATQEPSEGARRQHLGVLKVAPREHLWRQGQAGLNSLLSLVQGVQPHSGAPTMFRGQPRRDPKSALQEF